ncbi:hypothetical protein ABPG72_005110 [Tetrahymena utriculariae]
MLQECPALEDLSLKMQQITKIEYKLKLIIYKQQTSKINCHENQNRQIISVYSQKKRETQKSKDNFINQTCYQIPQAFAKSFKVQGQKLNSSVAIVAQGLQNLVNLEKLSIYLNFNNISEKGAIKVSNSLNSCSKLKFLSQDLKLQQWSKSDNKQKLLYKYEPECKLVSSNISCQNKHRSQN